MRKMLAIGAMLATILAFAPVAVLHSQDPAVAQPTAVQPTAVQAADPSAEDGLAAAAPGAHPLTPAIARAKAGLEHIRATIQDYSCTMVKREMVDGKLGEHQYIFMKIRHEPFSVYLSFLGPEEVKGQEVVWVDGRNDGNMSAHAGSGMKAMMGTVQLKPDSMIAMQGQRYPITEIGVENLTRKLIEVAEHDAQYGECTVDFFPGAKVNGRTCTCIQVTHPVPRRNFRYHLARVFIDDEMQIPTRFEAYEWPSAAGQPPVLVEEYTYMNVKLNNGFTDLDFDTTNTAYKFTSTK